MKRIYGNLSAIRIIYHVNLNDNPRAEILT